MVPIIEVDNLTKTFQIQTLRASTLKETVLINLWKRGEYRDFTALDRVSFAVERGQSVAILGSNGSGKSTLLRLLAGITKPTAGRLAVRGRSSSLIDLTAGLQSELTGIENVFFNASILGLPRREIRRRLHEIMDFAELGHYIHSPVKYYSTGMLVRLAFAISAHLDPEILLVDEALAVGDTYFQAKSLDRMRYLRRTRNTTILLVTHNLELADDMADRVLWLEKGRLRYDGDKTGGLDRILIEHHRLMPTLEQYPFTWELMYLLIRGRFGSGEALIRGVRFVDGQGREKCTFHTGERFTVEVDYEIVRPIPDGLACGIGIEREDGLTCTIVHAPAALEAAATPRRGTFRASLEPFDFLPGRYRVSVGLAPPGRPLDVYDAHLILYLVRVEGAPDDPPDRAAFLQRARFQLA